MEFCDELVKAMSHRRVVEHDVVSGLKSTEQYLKYEFKQWNITFFRIYTPEGSMRRPEVT